MPRRGPSPLAGQRPVYESASARTVRGTVRVTGKTVQGPGRLAIREFESYQSPVHTHKGTDMHLNSRARLRDPSRRPMRPDEIRARQERQAELDIYGREACAGSPRFRYRQDDKRNFCPCGLLRAIAGNCSSCD